MKRKGRIILASCLTGIAAALAVGITIGNFYAFKYEPIIALNLGQDTYKIVNNDSDEKVEDIYKSEFPSSRKLVREENKYAETIQSEGSVLLMNKNYALPATTAKNITLFGTTSVDFLYGGSGAGSISTLGTPTLKQAFENLDFKVNSTVWDLYSSGAGSSYRRAASSNTYKVGEAPVSIFTDDIKSSFSNYNDLAIVVIGRTGMENSDLALTTVEDSSKHSLQLSQNEIDTIKLAKDSGFKKVVVLLNTLNAMELNELDDLGVDACLWVGAGGQKGINAIPKMIKGDLVPSGRLVDTYAVDALSAPAMKNFGDYTFTNATSRNTSKYLNYSEGIYIGYKYYETRYEDKVLNQGNAGDYDYKKEVQFPFGYGLSYTNFEYSNFDVKENADTFDFRVTVKNTGGLASKDVVEIYMQSPYTDYDKTNNVEKSAIELVGFEKTDIIEPNKSETLTVSVKKSEMASYDYKKAQTYIVDSGTYYFALGDSAHDALNNILAKKGKNTSDGMDYDGNQSFVYTYEQKDFDSTTYATSLSGGAVNNKLSFADLTNYDKGEKYLTRSNWVDSFPKTYEVEDGSRKAQASNELLSDLQVPTITDNESNYTMPDFNLISGNGELSLVNLNGRSYDDPYWEVLLNQMSKEDMYNLVRVGGYQTGAIASIGKPGTIDKDGSAGISSTLVGGKGAFGYPVESVVSSTWNKAIAKRMGELVGEDGIYTKTSGWYAPSMNIHRTQFSGRNFEYFSEDGYLSGQFGAAMVEGAESKGLYCYIKHFAFNDQETNRGGVATFMNEQAAREIYLEPFKITVEEAHPHGVMAAMNRIGTRRVGHSKELMTDILRGEWNFEGMVITDQASFYTDYIGDVRPTLYAGVDLMLCTNSSLWKIEDYETSNMYCTLLRRATKNILYAVANSNAMNGVSAKTKIIRVMPDYEKWLIALDCVVGVLCAAGITWAVFLFKKKDEVEKPVEEKKAN